MFERRKLLALVLVLVPSTLLVLGSTTSVVRVRIDAVGIGFGTDGEATLTAVGSVFVVLPPGPMAVNFTGVATVLVEVPPGPIAVNSTM